MTNTDRIRYAVEHQKRTLEKHQHFSKHDVLVGQAKWNHIDVLAVRHTKQNELKEALGIKDDGTFNSPFVSRQLMVMRRLLHLLKPQAVVVVNALAATMLRKAPEGELDRNDEDCFHFRKSAAEAP